VLLTAVAIWPVWAYLLRAYTSPGADLAPAMVLALSLGWAAVKWWSARGSTAEVSGVSLLLLAAYAGAYPWLPPLARATLGLAALAAALTGLRGLDFRTNAGLTALLLLAAPAADTVAFFLGAPIRAASAQVAAAGLAMGGVPVVVEGAMLRVGGQLFSVDAPCSGVNGLWSGMVVASSLAVYRGLGPARTLALVATAAALCIPANGWRATSLVYLSRLGSKGIGIGGEAEHSLVGVIVFAVTIAALAALASGLSRSRALAARSGPGARFPAGRLSWSAAAVLVCAGAAAAVPLTPRMVDARPTASAFPGWPNDWLGRPINRLPETELDRRWAKLSPAPLARFALADGGELLLRWTDRAGRWLHPPEDCYRGHGYEVVSLSPVRALAPGHPEPVVWRRFEARKGGERLEVRSVILSAAGPSYPDPAWWWWHVSGPGASDSGPWWVATVQR